MDDAIRKRAIDVLQLDVLAAHGCERSCAEVAIDTLEKAGLALVDAKARERCHPPESQRPREPTATGRQPLGDRASVEAGLPHQDGDAPRLGQGCRCPCHAVSYPRVGQSECCETCRLGHCPQCGSARVHVAGCPNDPAEDAFGSETRDRAIAEISDRIHRRDLLATTRTALDEAGRTGFAVVDAAALRALIDRCERRGAGYQPRPEDGDEGVPPWAGCIACDRFEDGDEDAPIPHAADCPVRALRASLPREEG